MKISLEWLGDFLPDPITAEQAAEALTHGGLPVELIERHGADTVIDVEVTSNRADCLSHVGVARELAALLNRRFNAVTHMAADAQTPVSSVASVTIDPSAAALCPHYTARVIRGVTIKPSPQWMQRRLEAVGLRPINNVVDVTNYVMFEMGQPLHAFDFGKLGGRKIVVRTARQGESITSIDGHARKLDAGMLVIADEAAPVALAGVMGGIHSEVSGSTTSVLLESARFEPLSVRTTARKLAMKSDSSYRFERGIDPTLPLRASLRAAQLILEIAGGELLAGVAEAGRPAIQARAVTLRLSKMNDLLGVAIPAAQAVEALQRLQFSPVLKNESIETRVPSWRADVNIEVDLIEEVARVVGYDKIPIREQISIRVPPIDVKQRALELIRSTIVASGFFESITVSFVSDALADDFKSSGAKLPRAEPAVRKADAQLRPSLLPGLIESVRRNEAVGTPSVRLFETGSVFSADAGGNVIEQRKIAIISGGDLRDLRGVIEVLLAKLDSTADLRFVAAQHAGFDTAATGRIEWGGRAIGVLGKVAHDVVQKADLRAIPVAAELDLDALIVAAKHVPQLRPLPRFPSVRRDLSLVLDERTVFSDVAALIRSAGAQDLEDIEFVGVFRSKAIGAGRKSLTVSLVFRSPEQTLTGEAVEASVRKVVEKLGEIGATLRG